MYRPAVNRSGAAEGGLGGASTRVRDVPILMYHSIATSAAPRFARFVVRPEDFAAQMDHLVVEGYRPITARDLARKLAAGDRLARPVVLTFDDAFADFETIVMPILQKHRFPATLYVPTAYVGRTALWLHDCNEHQRTILSWRALRDIVSAEVEVASHSHTHPQLDRIALPLVRDEVQRSRQILEDNLGLPVDGFAYPFGYWNRSVRFTVSTAGYSYACAVGELPVSVPADLLTLPRVTVPGGVSLDSFARIVSGSSTPAARLSSEMKRLAWRCVRRHIRPVGRDPRPGRQVLLPAPDQNLAQLRAEADDSRPEEGSTSRDVSERL
jgi:peptidoglycan/xylan/chitin deacetylase (PgdA/CDA1 family)